MRKTRKNTKTSVSRRNWIKLILGVALLAAAAVAAVLICVFVFFKVSDIKVEGNKVCGTEEIIAASGVAPGDNLILTDSEGVKEKLMAAFPYIEDVRVKKDIPVTMKLVIKEAKISFSIPHKGMYAYVSKSGKLLELGKKPYKGSVILRAGEISDVNGWIEFGDKHEAEVFKELCKVLDNDTMKKLTMMDIRDVHNIYVVYDNRVKMSFGNISDIEYKMNFGIQILESKNIGGKEIGNLDLSLSRSDNKAYFQPASSIDDIVDSLKDEESKDKDADKKKPSENDKKDDKNPENDSTGKTDNGEPDEDDGTAEGGSADTGDNTGNDADADTEDGAGDDTDTDNTDGGDTDDEGPVENRGDDIPDIIV